MTKTVDQLVSQALRNLGISPQGGKAYPVVDTAAETLLNSLKRRDLVYVSNAAAIPDEWFLPLADLLADAVKIEFDRGADQNLMLRAAKAEVDLHLMRRGQMP